MRLKTLTLNGYKTFASKMAFEFGDGITCIIGPNGSGKSNVADGIRWALGEQQFSLLRGKKTEDMIFSGSAKRPRASMAEVILTFDNSDGFFPIEFSEIEIGRRAYRDGANEYVLNGNRVRLRDVSDLLGHSGLAERTYTVIGQGLVDNALAQKPEERRALFEEAAGIGAYRDRREDALRKLEETRHNLERARDILAEITPRLGQLERQAARARQYKVLADELDGHTRTWLGYHYRALQRAIDASSAARDQAQHLVGQALQAVNVLDEEGVSRRAGRGRLQQALTEAQARRDAARTTSEAAARELAVMRERAAAIEQQRVDVERDVEQQQRDLSTLVARAAEAETAFAAAQATHALKQSELDAAQASASDRQAERSALEAGRAQAHATLAAAAKALLDMQNQAAALRARKDALHDQLESMTRRANELGDQREAELQALSQLTSAIDHDASQTNLFDAQFEAAQHALEDARNTLAHAQSALAAAEAEDKLSSRMSLFAEMRAQQSADELAASAAAAGLPGVRGPLGSFIHIHGDDQKAVEAALGDRLNALIIESAGDDPVASGNAGLARTRAWLTEQPSGRLAIILPHALRELDDDRVRNDGILADHARASGARPLTDAISCPDWLKPALQIVAGRAFIARDFEAARDLAAQLPDGSLCVTRDGEVVDAIGTLSMPAGARTPIVLGIEDPPPFEELDVTRIKANLEGARGGREDAQRAFDETRHALDQALRARDTFAREAITRRGRVEEAERKVSRIEETLAALAGDMEAITQEIGELDDRIVQAAAQATEREQAQTHARTAADEAEGALSRQLAGGWLEALNASQAVLATAAGAMDNAALLQRERATALAVARGQIDNRRHRSAELGESQRAMQANLDVLQQTAERAEADWRAAIEGIQPLEREIADLEAGVSELETRKREAERALREAESHMNVVALELARHHDELTNLRQRAAELAAADDAERPPETQPVQGADIADTAIADTAITDAASTDDLATPQTTPPRANILDTLPAVDELPEGLEERIIQLRGQIKRLGAINYEAQTEYEELKRRSDFITEQSEDLEKASAALQQVIAELNDVMKDTFRQTFDAIATAFQGTFKMLFGGGQARLTLINPENIDECGVDIQAQPPGKRPQSLALLSGGERSLTATALLFAILQVKPTPFCVLDEVDAALDESNVGRFRSMVEGLSGDTQFIIITHNRRTVEAATTIYGISMGADGASTALSLRLEEVH